MRANVGDFVGAIYKYPEKYKIVKDEIIKIVIRKSGTKYYTKSKFTPLDANDVDYYTDLMEESTDMIITQEVFIMNDVTEGRSERWVKWANEHPEEVKSIWS